MCGSSSGQSFLNFQSYVCASIRQDEALNGVVNVGTSREWSISIKSVVRGRKIGLWLSRFVTSAYKRGYKWC